MVKLLPLSIPTLCNCFVHHVIVKVMYVLVFCSSTLTAPIIDSDSKSIDIKFILPKQNDLFIESGIYNKLSSFILFLYPHSCYSAV